MKSMLIFKSRSFGNPVTQIWLPSNDSCSMLRFRSLSIFTYTHAHTHTERERERERERDRHKHPHTQREREREREQIPTTKNNILKFSNKKKC